MTARPAHLTCLGAVSLALVGGVLVAPQASAEPGRVTNVSNAGELRAAVAAANASPGSATIRLTASIRFAADSGGTDRDGPLAGDLDVTDDLRVDGRTFGLSAGGVDRLFDVTGGTTLVLDRIILTGGRTSDNGGAIRSAGNTLLRGSLVVNNVVSGAGASGGAIFNDGGTLRVLSSRLITNRATRAGGAIEANAGSTLVSRSLLRGNVTGPSPGNGGALRLTGDGTVRVLGSRVIGNVAAAEGGGLWNSATGEMLVQASALVGNRALGASSDQGGGALYNDGGAMRVDRSRLQNNVASGASGSGGAILNNDGRLFVIASTLTGNVSRRAGGGIEAASGATLIARSILARNRTGGSPGNGGALHLGGAGSARILASQVLANSASAEGGGLWNSSSGTMVIDVSRVTGNSAQGPASDQGGGGIYNDGGDLRLTGSNVTGNGASGASGSGGGILNNDGKLTVKDTKIAGNSAKRAGGGIETVAGTVSLSQVDLLGNRVGRTPGNGGGLHVTGASSVFYEQGSVLSNAAAAEGGGLWNSATGALIAVGVTVRSNSAPVGPNVFNDGGTFLLNGRPVLAGNTSG